MAGRGRDRDSARGELEPEGDGRVFTSHPAGVVELEVGYEVFSRPQNLQPRDEATYFECRLAVQTPVWMIELTKWAGEVHTLDACSHP